MKNKIFYFLLFFVFLIGFLTRFIGLNKLPNGLDQDESAIGYNAYLINTTGRDEWNNKYPLYFKSFNDYKLPVYIYTVAIFERFLGVNIWAIRLPSAIAGFLSIIILYLLVKKLTNNNYLALTSSFLLALNPWSIFLSRGGFETNLATIFILTGIYLFYKFKDKYNLGWGILSVIFFSLSLYTYNVTRLVSPIIFLSLIIADFYKNNIKQNLYKYLILIIVVGIFSLPFLVSFFNHSVLNNDSAVLIYGGNSKAEMIELRSYLISFPNILSKLFFSLPVLIVIKYIGNLFAFFNVNFLFINGDSGLSGIGNNGQFYLFQFPLIVLGLRYFFKEKIKSLNIFLTWILISLFIVAISSQIPHGTRDFNMVIPLTVFSAAGLIFLFNTFSKLNKKYLYGFYLLIFIVIGYSILFFFTSYIFIFPKVYAETWRSEDYYLSIYLEQKENNYKNIYIKNDSNFIYTSFIFYTKYNPQVYLKTAVYNDSILFESLKSLGNLKFGDYNYENLSGKGKSLLITSGNYTKPGLNPIKTFYYPTLPKVLFINNSYYNLPVRPVAYYVYEINK